MQHFTMDKIWLDSCLCRWLCALYSIRISVFKYKTSQITFKNNCFVSNPIDFCYVQEEITVDKMHLSTWFEVHLVFFSVEDLSCFVSCTRSCQSCPPTVIKVYSPLLWTWYISKICVLMSSFHHFISPLLLSLLLSISSSPLHSAWQTGE